MKSLLIIFSIISCSIYAGSKDRGGGDSNTIDFLDYGHHFCNFLSSKRNIDKSKIDECFDYLVEIEKSLNNNDPLLIFERDSNSIHENGNPKEAAFDKIHRTIRIDRKVWKQNSARSNYLLVTIEISGILGLTNRYSQARAVNSSFKTYTNQNNELSCDLVKITTDVKNLISLKDIPLINTRGIYADKFYERVLTPGKIPYEQIFGPMDKLLEDSDKLIEGFKEKIQHLRMDKNGIIRITEVGDSYSELAAYASAIRGAYSRYTGLQVSGEHIRSNYSSMKVRDQEGKFVLEIYLTTDPLSNKKVETLKYESFNDLEKLASRIRREVLAIHSKDFEKARKAGLLAKAFGRKATLNEIINILYEVKDNRVRHKVDLEVDNVLIWLDDNIDSLVRDKKKYMREKLGLLRMLNRCARGVSGREKQLVKNLIDRMR